MHIDSEKILNEKVAQNIIIRIVIGKLNLFRNSPPLNAPIAANTRKKNNIIST